MSNDALSLVGLEAIGECRVLRDMVTQKGIETVEGRLVPLLSGEAIRSHIIVMHPGQYASAHPHEKESIIYTVSGSWVFCTIEDGEEKRIVIGPGDLFHFPGGAPTGFETPFEEPAVIFIVKPGSESYEELAAGMTGAREELERQAAEGEPFSYKDLEPDHPARVYARSLTGRDPGAT